MKDIYRIGLCVIAIVGHSAPAVADAFEDAAIARMIKLKNDYRKQVGSRYDGPGSRQGLSVTDCFRYTRSVLIHAFRKVGQSAHADKVNALYKDGGDVGKYLVEKANWRAYFWAPDVRVPGDGNEVHSFYARQANKQRKHFYKHPKLFPAQFIPIDGYIVNYNPTPISVYDEIAEGDNSKTIPTKKNTAGLDYINSVPFCYGITHGANHTFLLSKGQVFEVHWDVHGPTSDAPDDATKPGDNKLYEVSSFSGDFSNYTLDGWLSGVLICPPSAPAAPADLAKYDPGK
jgi:hypothetical protein